MVAGMLSTEMSFIGLRTLKKPCLLATCGEGSKPDTSLSALSIIDSKLGAIEFETQIVEERSLRAETVF